MPVNREWLSSNEARAYPLSGVGNRTGLPNNIIVDAQIALPRSVGRHVWLSSLYLSPGLVTFTLLGADDLTSVSGFVPLGVVHVPRPALRYKNYPITPMHPGVGGWVALGQGAIDIESLILNWKVPAETVFVDRCVRSYNDVPVKSLSKLGQSLQLSGLVALSGDGTSIVTRRETRIIGGAEREVAVIALALGDSPVDTLHRFTGTCGGRPQDKTCAVAPITQINDVKPDCDGNIQIEFGGDVTVGDIGQGIVLDTPVSLTNQCPGVPDEIFLDPVDGNFTIPIDEPPGPGSSTNPDPSSSEAGDPEYCEEFDDANHELETRVGLFSVSSGKLRSAPILGHQVAVDLKRRKDLYMLYKVRSLIRPLSAQGNGHVIFAYQDLNNFFFAGLTLRPSVEFPNGRLYIGRKLATPAGTNFPAGLGYGYQILVSIPPPTPLVDTEYSVRVELSKLLNEHLISYSCDWEDGNGDPQSIDQFLVLSAAQLPRFGYTGLGAVDSETEYDNFGIDCSLFD